MIALNSNSTAPAEVKDAIATNGSSELNTTTSTEDAAKKKEKSYVGPTELEKEIDEDMIEYARQQGITDPMLLTGRMSEETATIINQAKLKHRSCKSLSEFFYFL